MKEHIKMKKMFDYTCKECDITEEHYCERDAEQRCPQCSGIMERLIGTPAFKFDTKNGVYMGRKTSYANSK